MRIEEYKREKEIKQELKKLHNLAECFKTVCESLRGMGLYNLEEPLRKIEEGISISCKKMDEVVFPEEENEL